MGHVRSDDNPKQEHASVGVGQWQISSSWKQQSRFLTIVLGSGCRSGTFPPRLLCDPGERQTQQGLLRFLSQLPQNFDSRAEGVQHFSFEDVCDSVIAGTCFGGNKPKAGVEPGWPWEPRRNCAAQRLPPLEALLCVHVLPTVGPKDYCMGSPPRKHAKKKRLGLEASFCLHL